MCSAAKEGNFQGIKKLKEDGGDYSMTDYDGRTPLHIAAAAGTFLLKFYCSGYSTVILTLHERQP